jgi:SAM-dependent methyltransferase
MAEQTQWQVVGNAAENYEQYLVPAIFGPWARDLLALATLKPGGRVLDVACGSGIVARLAAERVGATGKVVGVDINPGMLAVARTTSGSAEIDWREGNATALPLPDGTFDVVLCQQGLQFFPDRAAALREMRRVLVPRGQLAVSCWKPIQRSPGFLALAEALAKHAGPEAAAIAFGPFALGEDGELRSLIESVGFENVSIREGVKSLRFPSGEEFVRRYGTGSPLAGVLTEMTASALSELVRDVSARVTAHLNAEGLAFVIEAHLALAYK